MLHELLQLPDEDHLYCDGLLRFSTLIPLFRPAAGDVAVVLVVKERDRRSALSLLETALVDPPIGQGRPLIWFFTDLPIGYIDRGEEEVATPDGLGGVLPTTWR